MGCRHGLQVNLLFLAVMFSLNHNRNQPGSLLLKIEQIILFQNRRGFSPVLECMTCGHIPQCTSCNVSLTYHKFKNQLRCHYCGYSIAKPTNCHACSSVDISAKGFGTEQIELELADLFPNMLLLFILF